MSHDVTILMPAYNGMPYLRDAVQSVRDQTLRNWRCVIVNDGSTDDTREFLDSIDDDRFVVRHQQNAGIAAAINHGLDYCDTKYVARLDADDVALPTRLAEQVAYMESHPDVGLVGSQVAPMGDSGSGRSLRLPLDHDAICEALLDGRHAMVHSSVMGRTALIKEIGGYWLYPIGEEYDLMLRLGEVSRLANIDRVLVHWRVHEQSLTGSKMRMTRFYIDYACELARRRQAGDPPISLDAVREPSATPVRFGRSGAKRSMCTPVASIASHSPNCTAASAGAAPCAWPGPPCALRGLPSNDSSGCCAPSRHPATSMQPNTLRLARRHTTRRTNRWLRSEARLDD